LKLPWLDPDTPFPPVEEALADPAGLLAAGADLSLPRLALAYANGVFPWYGPGEPILWWSPDPRMVLALDDFSPSHSLRKLLRKIAREEALAEPRVQVCVDTAFDQVMQACAAPRPGQPGTWITPAMQQAYRQWHAAGRVHSVETWMDGRLAGGLYCVNLGTMVFGESMFSLATDASKIALAHLVAFLRQHGVAWLDCQQETTHLARLGAAPVARGRFLQHLRNTVGQPDLPWRRGRLDSQGRYFDAPVLRTFT
jgi:leucyl/phenylalanyl-tRNA--protein transferase